MEDVAPARDRPGRGKKAINRGRAVGATLTATLFRRSYQHCQHLIMIQDQLSWYFIIMIQDQQCWHLIMIQDQLSWYFIMIHDQHCQHLNIIHDQLSWHFIMIHDQ